jgi:hypothetical protein
MPVEGENFENVTIWRKGEGRILQRCQRVNTLVRPGYGKIKPVIQLVIATLS